MLSSKDRLEQIEELEDDLIDKLESLDGAKSDELIRSLIIDICLLSQLDLEEHEKAYLLAQNSTGDSKAVSDEEIERLRLSLIKKIKGSVQLDQSLPIHWIHRLIYTLVFDGTTSASDQVELIFNAIDFCDLPIEEVREVIESKIN